MLITALDEDEGGALAASAKRLGGPLLFGRIWARLGIPEVLADLLADRGFEFSVESAVFVATLHRLFVSGSDRDCAAWMQDYDIAGAAGLDLHHFYRAMAWLGEEMGEKAEGALAPRCVKDVVEEKLFEKRRDLFCDLSAVFMDTTSLSFYGEGGETLGERGYSKDYRPDLAQMILALIVDGKGRPICTEMWPGITADVTTLLPVVDRLRQRFAIGRVCVVADRGMISGATIEGLEAQGLRRGAFDRLLQAGGSICSAWLLTVQNLRNPASSPADAHLLFDAFRRPAHCDQVKASRQTAERRRLLQHRLRCMVLVGVKRSFQSKMRELC